MADFPNTGLNYVLTTAFSGTNYYLGLKGVGTIASSDTLSSHAGWTEFTGYSGNRKLWQPDAVSSQSITNNTNKATFNITSSGIVAGTFICTVETGTAGTLVGVEDFSAAETVASGDIFEIEYEISAASN